MQDYNAPQQSSEEEKLSIITEEVLLDETGDDLNEREANKREFAQPILMEDLGHYDTKRILSSLTNIRVEVPLIFCQSFQLRAFQ